MLTNRTPQAHEWALDQFRTLHNDGPFAPMRVGQQTIVFPGFDGGAEWGGQAADPATGILYLNANDMAWTGGLAESPAASAWARSSIRTIAPAATAPTARGRRRPFPSLTDVAQA